ncbi:unnamed protein product [Peniophora sp. CBMAI 1063]|nr:unnamed protein product [Peniophora sp. CBMAI 1063]
MGSVLRGRRTCTCATERRPSWALRPHRPESSTLPQPFTIDDSPLQACTCSAPHSLLSSLGATSDARSPEIYDPKES